MCILEISDTRILKHYLLSLKYKIKSTFVQHERESSGVIETEEKELFYSSVRQRMYLPEKKKPKK